MSVLGAVALFLCVAILAFGYFVSLNAREQQATSKPVKRDFIGRKRG